MAGSSISDPASPERYPLAARLRRKAARAQPITFTLGQGIVTLSRDRANDACGANAMPKSSESSADSTFSVPNKHQYLSWQDPASQIQHLQRDEGHPVDAYYIQQRLQSAPGVVVRRAVCSGGLQWLTSRAPPSSKLRPRYSILADSHI